MPATALPPGANFGQVRFSPDEGAISEPTGGSTTIVLHEAWTTQSDMPTPYVVGPRTLSADEAAGLVQFWNGLPDRPAPQYTPLDLPPARRSRPSSRP